MGNNAVRHGMKLMCWLGDTCSVAEMGESMQLVMVRHLCVGWEIAWLQRSRR